MRPFLYELNWLVETDVNSFLYREFKVFDGEERAKKFGKKREAQLNDGIPIEEKSHNGFCYKYLGVHKVKDIDGFLIELKHE
jgi:hypothetical protein